MSLDSRAKVHDRLAELVGELSGAAHDSARLALDEALATLTPDFVLVSAGFDCMAGDPLGGFPLEPEDLFAMTRRIRPHVEVSRCRPDSPSVPSPSSGRSRWSSG